MSIARQKVVFDAVTVDCIYLLTPQGSHTSSSAFLGINLSLKLLERFKPYIFLVLVN